MAIEEDRLREIRTAISQAQSKTARAAVELDNAKERLKDAQATLTEFGVRNGEEAKAKLADLQSELDSAVAQIEAELAEAGA